MAIPRQTLRVRDPGLGIVELTGNLFVFVGTAEKGASNQVLPFTSPDQVVDEYGQGELSETLCHVLTVGGGPVYGCRVNASVNPVTSAVTKTAAGSSTGTISLSGNALYSYQGVIEIVTTGTTGAGRFRYSLDNGRTWSEEITIPSGGTFAIPNTGITATFTAGGGPTHFEAGDLYEFTTTSPHYGTTELADAVAAIRTYMSASPGFSFDAIFLTGRNATGSGAATLFGALSSHLASFFQSYAYMAGALDAGSGDTRSNVKSAFASVADRSIAAVYGDVVAVSGKPFAGFGAPLMPLLTVAAARAKGTANGETLISTDLARVADGPLTGVLAISHDEFHTPDLDDAKISTSRTFPMSAGYFLTNMRLKSPMGSDFLYWQHARIMNAACRAVAQEQMLFINAGFDTNPDGTIAEHEAKRLESRVNEKLRVVLMDPQNVEGTQGHVSAVRYSVNRSNNVLQSNKLMSRVAIRPKFYAKDIETELGFAANVG